MKALLIMCQILLLVCKRPTQDDEGLDIGFRQVRIYPSSFCAALQPDNVSVRQSHWTERRLRCRVDEPIHDLWRLDIATRRWSEPEQRGPRPCARMMSHGTVRAQSAPVNYSRTLQRC